MSPLVMIIAIVGGGLGILSTIYLLLSLPVVIVWKFYRKIRYSIPLTK